MFKLHNLILLGMLLGFGVGVVLWQASRGEAGPPGWMPGVLYVLDLLGPTLFMGALKMIIAPLIFASIVASVTSLPDLRELGAIGWKTLAYYLTTTTVAVSIGLAIVLLVQPGQQEQSRSAREKRVADLEQRRAAYVQETSEPALDDAGRPTPGYVVWLAGQEGGSASAADAARLAAMRGAEGRSLGEIFKQDVVEQLLMNPLRAMSLDPPNALGIIFFALLLGIACVVVGPPASAVRDFFVGISEATMKITHWIIAVSPLAVACIVAKLVAETGPDVFKALAWFCGTFLGGVVLHVSALLAIVGLVGGVSPRRFFSGMREAFLIAFTTRSSMATLPVTIANVTENLDVSPKVANFSLPLGATMNMDGTAMYQAIAVIFLIQIFGGVDDVQVHLNAGTLLVVLFAAVLSSIGAAAVPNAGLVTLVIVASAVNLPIYYLPLIFAVDSVMDMFRTLTNVLGDSVGAVVVNRLERGRL